MGWGVAHGVRRGGGLTHAVFKDIHQRDTDDISTRSDTKTATQREKKSRMVRWARALKGWALGSHAAG